MDERRPILIHGGDLIEFLETRQAKRKQTCATDEFYCFRCRRPRHPRFGRVHRDPQRDEARSLWRVRHLRHTYASRWLARRLSEYLKAFTIETPGERRLSGCSDPSVMCHSEEKSHGS